jgi:tetratricopeptide (TPR) repeat protein
LAERLNAERIMIRRSGVALVAGLVVTAVVSPSAVAGQAIEILNRDIKDIEAMARADSNDAQLQFFLALANWKRHRWTQTDSLLRLAVSIDPHFAEGYLALAYLPYSRRTTLWDEEQHGRVPESWRPILKEADGFCARAFRTSPLVNLRAMSVVFEIEEPRFEDLTSPEYQACERYYAWFFDLGLGRYRAARNRLETLGRAQFDEASHPDKVPGFILWYRGLAAAHAQMYDAAIADFQSLLARTVKKQEGDEIIHVPLQDNEYRFILASVLQVAGHPDSARALFQECVEHDLGLSMAHTYLAGIWESAGQMDSGLVERRRAVESSDNDPVPLLELGLALFNAGKLAHAEPPLRKALQINPRYTPPYYLLGRTSAELNRPAEARAQFTRFLALAPHRYQNLRTEAEQRLAALPK